MKSTRSLVMLLLLPATALAFGDGPEISRSRGPKGGVVVLSPRVVPESTDPQLVEIAAQVQQRLSAAATRAAAGKTVDTRPAPERVCPQVGCRAVSVTSMLAQREGGCAVVAAVGPPGASAQTLVPLVGGARVPTPTMPFRTPFERQVTVTEFVPCDQVLSQLETSSLEASLASLLAQAAL